MGKSKTHWIPWAVGGGLLGAWAVYLSRPSQPLIAGGWERAALNPFGRQAIGIDPNTVHGMAHPKTRAARRIRSLTARGFEAVAVETPSGTIVFSR